MDLPRSCCQAVTFRVAVASMSTFGLITFQPVRAQVETLIVFAGSSSESTIRAVR
jgi:hypothetical protein